MRALVYDVAVVLGAAVNPDGSPSPALLRRTMHGVTLYRSGRARHLLMSGRGLRSSPSEASLMRQAALAAGIPESAVLIEDRSLNTLDNARFSKPIIEERGWTRVLVVSDGYHLRRALYTFRRFGVGAEGEAVPSPRLDARWVYAHLREAIGLMIYRWRLRPTRLGRGRRGRGG